MKISGRHAAALLFVFAASLARAESVGDKIPGTIPLKPHSSHAASDLVSEGRLLSPDEANLLSHKSDISLLDPRGDSDLFPGQRVASPPLGYQADAPFQFLDRSASIPGRLLFTVTQSSPEQGDRQFSVLLGPTVRNVLYQKALLERLGYAVPPAEWLGRMKLQFDSSLSRDAFTRQIFDATLGDPSRWAKAEGENELLLQDVVILERSQSKMYNLSLGYLPADRIADRRVLRALAVSYELMNIPESVNYLRWDFGSVTSNHVALSFDHGDEFIGNYEDSRWLARRIARLTRADFAAIAAAGGAPKEVQLLLAEKLVARRNDLVELFKLGVPPLKVTSGVSSGKALQNGRLVQVTWPGYGSRFSESPSKDSPFSSEQMASFFKAKLSANIMSNAMAYFNNHVVPSVDIASIVVDKEVDALVKQFLHYLETGEMQKIPLKAFVVPYPSAKVIASRDIVLGSYMGTENKVQLADTVGLTLSLGAYIGVLGVPAPWQVSGNVKGSVTRTYTHLRPVSNLKTALKYPFRNVAVPLFQRSIAKLIDGYSTPAAGQAPSAEQAEQLAQVVKNLKEHLLLNESMIVSDSVGPELSVGASYEIAKFTSAYASFSASQLLLRRIHITRSGEDEIQIYRDLGETTGFTVTIGLNALAPIITISAGASTGSARVQFYKIDLNPNLAVNTSLPQGLKALRQVLTSQKFEALDFYQSPVLLQSKFRQANSAFNFLFFRSETMESDTWMQASRKSGGREEKISLLHSNSQRMRGKDFQSFFLSLVNSSVATLAKIKDVSVQSAGNGRASDSIYGSSVVHQSTFDTEIRTSGGKSSIEQPFLNLSTNWAGWKISKAKAEQILAEIAKITGKKLYAPQILQNASEIQLYSITLYTNIYADGLRFFLSLSDKQIRDQLDPLGTAQHVGEFPSIETHKNEMDVLLEEIFRQKANISKAIGQGNTAKISHGLMRVAEAVHFSMGTRKLMKLFGGEENVLVGSSISGFRNGVERGEETLLGRGLGELGSRQFSGPVEAVRTSLGASSSEFYLQWILRRL